MQDFLKSIKQIEEAIQTWQTKSSDKYSHLEKSEIDKVYKILNEKRKWYEQTATRFHSLKQHEDPTIVCTQIKQQQEVNNHNLSSFRITFVYTFRHSKENVGQY